ncbi:glycoside hydrolase family 6 protein [Micromonospora sp. DT81.3]|uniref:glycoside hydrolase family 6 protein n=1 Tax=Micromonospora sp. DT81.3 TaxID=3416523 RepID=UPI003CEDBB1A
MTHLFRTRARWAALAAVGVVAASLTAIAPASAAEPGDLAGSDLYLNPYSTTLEAAQSLSGQARADAQLLGSIPSANWFTSGTAAEVQVAVDEVVSDAAAKGQMPVLVAYNLPFRDCAQYSAGGAADTAEYNAWIDGFAAGIGDRAATIILEPDGLGIIPWNTDINGNAEWCQPAELDPATAVGNRYAQLNHAVDAFAALAATSVYLDGTHSGWLGVGDISNRLILGGVAKADGFFLNASNYVQTERLQKYGQWISDCVYLSQNSWWEPSYCGSQYYPANPDDFSTWGLTDATYDKAFADTGLTRDPAVQAHFVIDTSRNGQGPWTAPAGAYPDPEVWCNPPGRGAGEVPSTTTGNALIDAYLWIKVPGESDGKCYRGTGGPLDPARGIEDPAAGQWFPEQARELVALSNPPLTPLTCHVKVKDTQIGSRFVSALVVQNNGTTTTDPWTLSWSFEGDQKVTRVVGGSYSQTGADLTVTGTKLLPKLAPGKKAAVVLTGKGAADAPWLFFLNGEPCTSS